MCRILISIGDAQAGSLFAKPVQNFIIEPGWAAELKCTSHIAANQGEKIFQHRPVLTKALGKLKENRPQFPVQNRQRPEEVLGLLGHISELLQMRYDLGALSAKTKSPGTCPART